MVHREFPKGRGIMVSPRSHRALFSPCLSGAFLVLAVLVVSNSLNAQTRDQLRQKAEEQLKRMTPEEVERKLKELGMSRWEAIRRAQDFGITLEEYLAKTAVPAEETQPKVVVESEGAKVVVPTEKRKVEPVAKEVGVVTIPGFVGRTGIDKDIRPFGFEFFEFPASTFEPIVNMATPPSYVLGPGDELVVTVWGETKLNYLSTINREGNVVIPEVGPVSANGQNIQQYREKLLRRMTAVYSGLRNGAPGANTFLDVSLGKLRSVQVFVTGEVKKPGGYIVSSMSTVMHALYVAAGPSVQGTLREVKLARAGARPIDIDLYEYIAKADRSKDARLQDGDIIFVGPAKRRVALVGNVVRPAVYELSEKESLKDLLSLAGGPRFDADLRRVHVERIIPFEQRAEYENDVLDIDLTFRDLQHLQTDSTPLMDGDIVTVFTTSRFPQNRVSITGNVVKPGPFEWSRGLKVKDLILAADSLSRGTFIERGVLLRLLPNLRREAIPFSPGRALENDPANNIVLQNEDSLIIFNELEMKPVVKVAITGAIRNPNYYDRYENMTLQDLVMLAGGLQESAELTGWEISRVDTSSLGVYAKIIKIQTPFEYHPKHDSDLVYLRDYDYVFVPFNPRFRVQKFIDLQGYVMYPGPYPIRFEGERLADVIKRAGGLRPGAYLEGSKLYRRGGVGEKIQTGQVPIDFRKALYEQRSRDNIALYERDSIYVSFLEDVVRVSGEVFVPSAILYSPGKNIDYYIEQAGGITENADDDKIYAFLPGGKKYESGELLPGSHVFVPRIVEKEDKTLPIIRDLATILASLAAITVALIQVSR